MKWDSVQQLVRIGAYAAGGALLGDAVASSAQFQGAVGGVLALGSFVWWYFWERQRP